MPDELEVKPLETQPTNVNDLEDRIAKAREEEKNKLYLTLEREKTKAKELADKLAEQERQLREFTEFKNNVELEKLGEKERLEAKLKQLEDKLKDTERKSE